MKYSILIILLAFSVFSCKNEPTQEAKNSKAEDPDIREVLLIGTFHFNNPGADVAKTKSFDIMNDGSQAELDEIADKIADFGPSKIFVEWDYDEQQELNSLYKDYLKGVYFKKDSLSDFYLKNEIFQLAFRAGKKSGLESIYGIDYRGTSFHFDSLMTVIAASGQTDLQEQIGGAIEEFTTDFDEKIASGISLKQLIYHLNSKESQRMSNTFHNTIPLLAGDPENMIGPFLTSEWYKRNLYMWSQVLKRSREEDKRVMILLGASHAAIIRQFIAENEAWEVVELKQLMEKGQ